MSKRKRYDHLSLTSTNVQKVSYCDVLKEKQDKMVKLRREITTIQKKCDNEIYHTLSGYFHNESKVGDLLVVLRKWMKKNKKEIGFKDYLNLFPRDSSLKGTNFRRQHVYECICRLLLLLGYDNGELGETKQFIKSVESYTNHLTNPEKTYLTANDILYEPINQGSSGQSVDICFKNEREFILIQNKYYDREKSDPSKYDINKIYQRAQPLTKTNQEFKIILMVNDAANLRSKFMMQTTRDSSIVAQIYGVRDMEEWFRRMVNDLTAFKSDQDVTEFIKHRSDSTTPFLKILHLRFHQEWIVNSILHKIYVQKKDKFIIGAVPRSGKTYMMMGLIAERMRRFSNETSQTIIVLGAKSETEQQLTALLKEHREFDEYGIHLGSDKGDIIERAQNIYIFSKEKLKHNHDGDSFSHEFIEKYDAIFNNGNRVDLYFDEIHNGGVTVLSQNKILRAFQNSLVWVDLFIMITATYAKPLLLYEKESELVTWSYDDVITMKNIFNEDELTGVCTDPQDVIFENLKEKYRNIYGEDYFVHKIREQYQDYPEIVLIQPFVNIKGKRRLRNIHANVFRMKSDAFDVKVGKRLERMKPTNIFVNHTHVTDLLNYIACEGDVIEPNKSVYGMLKHKCGYDLNQNHTEIWFLPDTNMMDKSTDPQTHTHVIEPLTRGLALSLMSHAYFSRRYCVLIVHQTKLNYLGEGINRETFFRNQCVNISNEEALDIKSLIQKYELDAFTQNKSLIILAGSMLRLGISLPNVDIVFNMDNVQSIDVNVQTMFRVLTERIESTKEYVDHEIATQVHYPSKKEYGFYIDMNPERQWRFFHDYYHHYSRYANDSEKDVSERIQSLMVLFHYNGFDILEDTEEHKLRLYKKLTKYLRVRNEDMDCHLIQTANTDIRQILNEIPKVDLEKTFGTIMTLLNGDEFSHRCQTDHLSVSLSLSTQSQTQSSTSSSSQQSRTSSNDDNLTLELDDTAFHKIGDFLLFIVSLLSVFSNENGLDCREISECVDICLVDETNILITYLKRIYGLSVDQTTTMLRSLLSVIDRNDTLSNFMTRTFQARRKTNPQIYVHNDNLLYEKKEAVYDFIKQVPVSDKERSTFSDFSTPISLIDEMFSQLPDSIWKDPNKKWIDPLCGLGTFMIEVFFRLDEGLKDMYTNKELRREHIVKKQLFMVDINPKNTSILRMIFGEDANIQTADILETEEVFEGHTFDIVFANPPFRKKVWNYVETVLDLKKENGYICLIIPPKWRGHNNLEWLWNYFENTTLIYVHMYSNTQSKQLFRTDVKFDLIIHKNGPNVHKLKTTVVDFMNNVQDIRLKNFSMLPNYNIAVLKSLFTRTTENTFQIIHSTKYNTTNDYVGEDKFGAFKYQVIHKINEGGPQIYYSTTKSYGIFGKSKIIIGTGKYPYPIKDNRGIYGITSNVFALDISDKSNMDKYVQIINSKDFYNQVILPTRFTHFSIHQDLFSRIHRNKLLTMFDYVLT